METPTPVREVNYDPTRYATPEAIQPYSSHRYTTMDRLFIPKDPMEGHDYSKDPVAFGITTEMWEEEKKYHDLKREEAFIRKQQAAQIESARKKREGQKAYKLWQQKKNQERSEQARKNIHPSGLDANQQRKLQEQQKATRLLAVEQNFTAWQEQKRQLEQQARVEARMKAEAEAQVKREKQEQSKESWSHWVKKKARLERERILAEEENNLIYKWRNKIERAEMVKRIYR